MKGWMPPIPRRTQTAWARETLMDVIDNYLLLEADDDWDADDLAALKKERDRVAKFLGISPPPSRTLQAFRP